MGLETGDFISDLVQTNPVTATDPVTEGSNHLQLLKKVLQQTFGLMDELWVIPTNDTPLRARNFSNSGYLPLIALNPSDEVLIAGGTGQVISGAVFIGTPAALFSGGEGLAVVSSAGSAFRSTNVARGAIKLHNNQADGVQIEYRDAAGVIRATSLIESATASLIQSSAFGHKFQGGGLLTASAGLTVSAGNMLLTAGNLNLSNGSS